MGIIFKWGVAEAGFRGRNDVAKPVCILLANIVKDTFLKRYEKKQGRSKIEIQHRARSAFCFQLEAWEWVDLH